MVRYLLILVALAIGWAIAYEINTTASPELSASANADPIPEIIVRPSPQAAVAASSPVFTVKQSAEVATDSADAPRRVQAEVEPDLDK